MKNYIAGIMLFLVIGLPVVSEAMLIGPYSGIVLDSQTGEPVEGASVLIYWTKRVPVLTQSYSETIAARLVYTDKEGKYNISGFLANLGLTSFFESTNIIIYQPGYQAYIKQIYYNNPYSKPDPNYKEKDNVVKLDRIPPNFSHRKHYEDIDHALWGLDSVPYPGENEKSVTWDMFLEKNLNSGTLEKEEFPRRVEWEERRGIQEDRR